VPILISLLVDDGSPVNPMFFHDPPYPHDLLIPNTLAMSFADLCDQYSVRGKFSILPMPCCLGAIDEKLNRVTQRHLTKFLKVIRDRIAPRFDITPEILTHLTAYRLEKGGFHHLYEDEWVQQASVAEMTDYFALALEILRDVGLPANGITSPWNTGINNEPDYVQAIGEAQWRVHQRSLTWYFLHGLGNKPPRGPSISYRNQKTGQVVVSIPATTNDPFWDTQRPMSNTRRAARAAARTGIDSLLAADGKSGRIPDVISANCPVTILTHWQSLYSDGTCAGLWGLDKLLRRLQAHYGDNLVWTTCSDLAINTLGAAAN